ncbi:transcriptional regulator WhiB [Micromonospora fulviviridis]|nr:transcriptional regulator WhiB [Micromonospora fulviviridis]
MRMHIGIATKRYLATHLRMRSVAAMDWRHDAVCRDEDPELFFPIGTSGPALLQVEQAKAVCRRCPVTDHCLQWALESGQDAGVWGGMSEEERRAVKRRGGLRVLRAHSA